MLAGLLCTFPALSQYKTRVEEIAKQRQEKQARIWPERTSPVATQLNGLVERGLLDGMGTGKGANGPQLVLGGMRSGNGASFGVGYRRSDIWRDRIGFRSTIRGTLAEALMMDFELNSPRLRSERGAVEFYAKYENSPQMDYYGQGAESAKSLRTSFRLEDTSIEVRGSYHVLGNIRLRGAVGGLLVHTGRGSRGGFPSIEEIFDSTTAPGLGDQSSFLRSTGGVQFDYRDNPNGARSGGNYYVDFTNYSDRSLRNHSFKQLEMAAEQFIPYANRTRVIALRVGAAMAFTDTGQTVPYYLQPVLGGNQFLRGFGWYRFHDDSMVAATVEHRWYVFSGMDAALFFEAGKVAPKIRLLNLNELEYSGGLGLRFRIHDTVVMRIDQAVSREGYRFMWTFSDVF